MKTPFTTEQFFEIFEKYNTSVFPVQLIIIALGIIGLVLIHSRNSVRKKLISILLGILWLWTGIVYHITFFTSINQAAYVFGSLFIIQGIFFFVEMLRGRLEFSFGGSVREYIGYFFILFGLIIYPIISYLLEGSVSRTISPGLPCPTTIMTFGFLMLTTDKLSKYLLIIPVIWAVIGTSAAISFGVYQDYVMILAAIVAGIYLFGRKQKLS